jgi:hypothetical protein
MTIHSFRDLTLNKEVSDFRFCRVETVFVFGVAIGGFLQNHQAFADNCIAAKNPLSNSASLLSRKSGFFF